MRGLGLITLGAIAACTFYPAPDATHIYQCNDGNCPDGLKCDPMLNLCLAADGGADSGTPPPQSDGGDAGQLAYSFADAGALLLSPLALGGPVRQILPLDANTSLAVGSSLWISDGGPWVDIGDSLREAVADAGGGLDGFVLDQVLVAGTAWFAEVNSNSVSQSSVGVVTALLESQSGSGWTLLTTPAAVGAQAPVEIAAAGGGMSATLWALQSGSSEQDYGLYQVGSATPAISLSSCSDIVGTPAGVYAIQPYPDGGVLISFITSLADGGVSVARNAIWTTESFGVTAALKPFPGRNGCDAGVGPIARVQVLADAGPTDVLLFESGVSPCSSGGCQAVLAVKWDAGAVTALPLPLDAGISLAEGANPWPQLGLDLGPPDGGQSLWISQDHQIYVLPVPTDATVSWRGAHYLNLPGDLRVEALGPLGSDMLDANGTQVGQLTPLLNIVLDGGPDGGSVASIEPPSFVAGLNGAALDSFSLVLGQSLGTGATALFGIGGSRSQRPDIYLAIDGGFNLITRGFQSCSELLGTGEHVLVLQCTNGSVYSFDAASPPTDPPTAVTLPEVVTAPVIFLSQGDGGIGTAYTVAEAVGAQGPGVYATLVTQTDSVTMVYPTPLPVDATAPMWGSEAGATSVMAYGFYDAGGLVALSGADAYDLVSSTLTSASLQAEAVDPTNGNRFELAVSVDLSTQLLECLYTPPCVDGGASNCLPNASNGSIDCEPLCSTGKGNVGSMTFDPDGGLWVIGNIDATYGAYSTALGSQSVYYISATDRVQAPRQANASVPCPQVSLLFGDGGGFPEGLVRVAPGPEGLIFFTGTAHLFSAHP